MKATRMLFAVPLAAALAVLGACAPQPGAVEGYRAIDETDGLISLDLPEFKTTTPTRVTHLNSIQRQEYALMEGSAARAEVVLVQARHFFLENVSLRVTLDTEDVVGLWNAFKGKDLKLAPSQWHHAGWSGFWYRPFQVTDEKRACVAFNTEWDIHAADENLRPDQALFGYYCAAPGETMSAGKIDQVMETVGVRGVNKRFRGTNLELAMAPDPSRQDILAGTARAGGPAKNRGTDQFPFDMAEVYTIHGECTGAEC